MVGITSSSDYTLHLPRLLCLHGGGTNARIFRAQCRVLEKTLMPFFRLCYAQAPFYSEPGSDVVSVYKNWTPFRAWLGPEHDIDCVPQEIQACLRKAMAEDDMIGATGEFVGLLGFSQGAKICGSLLLAQQICEAEWESSIMPTWKFAILLAGRGPLVLATPSAARAADWHDLICTTIPSGPTTPTRPHLEFPTVHVHGLRDPALDLHRKFLHENFDQRRAKVIEWDGEHRVPIKTKDVAAVVKEMLSIARGAGILAENAQHQDVPSDVDLRL